MHEQCADGLGSPSLFSAPDSMTEDELRLAYVRHILAVCNNNKTRAARRLGIDRRSLYRRLKEKAR